MLFSQFVDDDLGCASYLVGDEHAGVAVVVDPAYAIEQYLEEAERRGVRLVGVLETHTHADHVSGHGRLALEHGLPVRVHEAAGAAFPHEPLDGRDRGRARRRRRADDPHAGPPARALRVRGDRPTRGDEPWLVLTGDSLFVGDAARPDLAVEAREGAEGLFHSLHRLVALGDGVEVYPGPRRRLALRRGDELEGVDDDRLRAALQPRARSRATTSSSRPRSGRSRRARRTWSGSSSSTAARSSARSRRSRQVDDGGRRGRARRAARARVRRRPPSRRRQRPGLRLELRHEGRVRPPRAARRARRRRRDEAAARGARAARRGDLRPRRLAARAAATSASSR